MNISDKVFENIVNGVVQAIDNGSDDCDCPQRL